MEGGALAPGQKKAIEEQRTMVFADQSGFYSLPLVMRTYAPAGQTPVIKEYLTHDHLSGYWADISWLLGWVFGAW